MRSLTVTVLTGAVGAAAFAPLRHSALHPTAAILTKPQQEPTRAAFATHPAIAARRRPAALALPLEHEPVPAKQRSFLGRLLQRRGGDSAAGRADLKAPLAEAVATGILTLAIGLISATSSGLSGGAKAVGVAVTLYTLLLTNKVSHCHVNPIVTFGMVLLGKMPFGYGLVYAISQVIGGLGGAFLAKSLLAPNLLGDPSFTLTGGNLLVEVFFSFSLMLTVFQTTLSKVQSRQNVAAPAISALVGLGAALGANMNPAVSWGLQAATGQDKGSLALWLLPALATIKAALAFRFTDAEESEGPSPYVSYLPRLLSAKNVRSIAPYVAEYINTFALTAAACVALVTGRLAAPVAVGLMFLVLNLAGGYVSGNHLNPAVTVGLYLRKGGNRGRAIGYIIAQLLGAFVGASAAHTAFGADAVVGKVLPLVAAGATEGQTFGAEMLFMGLFVQAIMILSSGQVGATTANLGITAALTAGLAAAGGVSGGGLNPAIATALYLKNAAKDQARLLWLYWVAPCLGAALAAVVNKSAAESSKGAPVGAN